MHSSSLHIAIFPFMSKGHTIPLLHLVRLLCQRRLVSHVTVFVTPLNVSFLHSILSTITADNINIIPLHFPEDLPQSLHQVTSLTSFVSFVRSFQLLQPQFEKTMKSLLPPVSFLISDPFLLWPIESAKRLAIPNLSFSGMGCFGNMLRILLQKHKPHAHLMPDDLMPFAIPDFPQIELTMAEVNEPLDTPNQSGPVHEYDMEITKAMSASDGMIVNSFYDLEAPYCDYWEASIGPKQWCVGPLCLSVPDIYPTERPPWIKWLDSKLENNTPVLYISFGTQAAVSEKQLKELTSALENSKVNFLWALKENESCIEADFKDRVKNHGFIVREWVDQLQILRHENVRGFMSHCGWNSVLEGISCGIPFIAWPMMADQYFNSKYVVDELKIGIRVWARDGTRDGLVVREDIEVAIQELMASDVKSEELRRNVKNLERQARCAVLEEGGSSVTALEQMIREFRGTKN
ncbi:UDP-glycosyltransferase 90A1-like protein [Carex littledalei]|uniref:UDP-glycosyltransferase 90A1-like protein n=1 Tax=Carex littledalei TaxID=544730 RepID=A0A833V7D5_9POAL|nr:UDP-glycosyltransferase 90A1-like protein [Carex littledalei]